MCDSVIEDFWLNGRLSRFSILLERSDYRPGHACQLRFLGLHLLTAMSQVPPQSSISMAAF